MAFIRTADLLFTHRSDAMATVILIGLRRGAVSAMTRQSRADAGGAPRRPRLGGSSWTSIVAMARSVPRGAAVFMLALAIRTRRSPQDVAFSAAASP
jgi:hypothetical protein